MSEWMERSLGSLVVFAPRNLPSDLVIAVSGRGVAPLEEPSPTAFLARRLTGAIGLDAIPIVRATQVHGNRAVTIRERPRDGEIFDGGTCDILATDATGVALVIQTADCVPILLAGRQTIGAVHAGWRGSAARAAASGVTVLAQLGDEPRALRAWIGPSIGPCCYEVGGEVAAQFAGEFVRRECSGKFRLDLPAINRAELEAAGILRDNIHEHPACTRCGGQKFASHRRDGARAGRMIALIARVVDTQRRETQGPE